MSSTAGPNFRRCNVQSSDLDIFCSCVGYFYSKFCRISTVDCLRVISDFSIKICLIGIIYLNFNIKTLFFNTRPLITTIWAYICLTNTRFGWIFWTDIFIESICTRTEISTNNTIRESSLPLGIIVKTIITIRALSLCTTVVIFNRSSQNLSF